MTTPAPHKLSNIQALRGLAALLVVFTHLPSMEIKHGGDSILPAFIRFGISGVDLFFVISGFIMVYVTWESRRNAKNSLKFLFARLSRIYPIYWFIAALVLAAWKIQPDLMSFDPRLTSLWKSKLLECMRQPHNWLHSLNQANQLNQSQYLAQSPSGHIDQR